MRAHSPFICVIRKLSDCQSNQKRVLILTPISKGLCTELVSTWLRNMTMWISHLILGLCLCHNMITASAPWPMDLLAEKNKYKQANKQTHKRRFIRGWREQFHLEKNHISSRKLSRPLQKMSALWGKYPWISLERISDPGQECSKGVSSTLSPAFAGDEGRWR